MNNHKEPYAEVHQRAMEFLARLTPEEGRALLQRAGILDEKGHLAAKYISPGEPVVDAQPRGVEEAPTP